MKELYEAIYLSTVKSHDSMKQYEIMKKLFFKLNIKIEFLTTTEIDSFKKTKFLVIDAPQSYNLVYERIRYEKLIYRARGIQSEEIRYKHRFFGNFIHLKYRKNEVDLMKKSDLVIFVSKELEDYFCNFGITKLKSCVIPNSFFKDELSEQLLKKDKKMCYVGGLSKWQSIELIKSFSIELLKNSDLDIEIFVPKNSLKKAKEYFLNFKVESLNEEQLNQKLISFNSGIIFRDNHIVNTTACPFKVADYLKSGLKVIMTDNIGFWNQFNEFDSIILKKNIDFFKKLDSMKIELLSEFIKKDINEDQRCRLINLCSIDNYIDDFCIKMSELK